MRRVFFFVVIGFLTDVGLHYFFPYILRNHLGLLISILGNLEIRCVWFLWTDAQLKAHCTLHVRGTLDSVRTQGSFGRTCCNLKQQCGRTAVLGCQFMTRYASVAQPLTKLVFGLHSIKALPLPVSLFKFDNISFFFLAKQQKIMS